MAGYRPAGPHCAASGPSRHQGLGAPSSCTGSRARRTKLRRRAAPRRPRREVCGFPRVVHGGLTAAIIDESFGGLLFALKQQKALNFWGPGE